MGKGTKKRKNKAQRMEAKRQARLQFVRQERRGMIVWIGVILLVIGAAVLAWRFPDWRRGNVALGVQVILRALLSVSVLYFTWWRKNEDAIPMVGKVLSVLFVCRWWLPFFCTNRAILLADMVLLLLFVGAMGFWYWTNEKHFLLLDAEAIFLLWLMLGDQPRSVYAERPNALRFWQIALVVSLIVLGISVVIELRNGSHRMAERILTPLSVGFLTFFLTVSMMGNLNYALDRGEPIRLETYITEIDMNTGGSKSPTKYYVYAQLDGELVELQVSMLFWRECEIGDVISVSCYEGALGHAYYMVNEP